MKKFIVKINYYMDFYRFLKFNRSEIEKKLFFFSDTFSADNNCELKRAATEMEDLLTGLIEGMESRKGKLTSIV